MCARTYIQIWGWGAYEQRGTLSLDTQRETWHPSQRHREGHCNTHTHTHTHTYTQPQPASLAFSPHLSILCSGREWWICTLEGTRVERSPGPLTTSLPLQRTWTLPLSKQRAGLKGGAPLQSASCLLLPPPPAGSIWTRGGNWRCRVQGRGLAHRGRTNDPPWSPRPRMWPTPTVTQRPPGGSRAERIKGTQDLVSPKHLLCAKAWPCSKVPLPRISLEIPHVGVLLSLPHTKEPN